MHVPETVDEVLDASGLQCPVPLAKTSKALNGLNPGSVLKVIATDEGSVLDFRSWAQQSSKCELLAQETRAGDDGKTRYIHYLRRK
jgi:tRNA 2-thiouridine synthesizing protein A